ERAGTAEAPPGVERLQPERDPAYHARRPATMTRIQLENLPHLRALGPALARLRTLARSQRFEPDEVLHRQGEPRDRLMLIRNGHVQVCVEEGPMGERPLVLLGRGDVLGEGLIVGSGVHSNTARALSRVAVFAVA